MMLREREGGFRSGARMVLILEEAASGTLTFVLDTDSAATGGERGRESRKVCKHEKSMSSLLSERPYDQKFQWRIFAAWSSSVCYCCSQCEFLSFQKSHVSIYDDLYVHSYL